MGKIIKNFIKFCIAWCRIPKGSYCYKFVKMTYDKELKLPVRITKTCPYWRRIDHLHEQENGYCEYLKRGDYDRNNSDEIFMEIDPKDNTVRKRWKAKEMPIGVGLLWDKCKECGIKEYKKRMK